jgi:hypothetical protein
LAALVALVVTAVVCGRSLGRGLYLYRDFVTVPEPAWSPATWGDGPAPRAVPLDAVMTALSGAVSTGVQQQAMLTGAVFLAGLGIAVLLRRWGLAAMVTGAVLAMWNPYVAERLLVGQPPTLLAYSMTPWLLAVVLSRFAGAKALLVVAVLGLPAALTPWGALVAGGVVLSSSLLSPHRRRAGWLLGCALVAIAWCLPWVVPALAHSVGGADPDGARAFALAADSPLGVLGSALTLGGIWAPGAQLASRDAGATVFASCLILAAAAVGVVALHRGRSRPTLILGLAWLVPPVAAWLLSTGPGLSVFAHLQGVPGVAIGRDTHRWLGLSALAVAVRVGVGVGQLSRWLQQRTKPTETPTGAPPPARLVSGAAVVVVASLAVLSAPDLPKAVHTAYRPITMPADWDATVRAAAEAAGDGTVAVLPWQPFRSVSWAGEGSFLDPLPRALPGRVLTAHELTVVRDDQPITVDDDASGYAAWRAGQLDVADLRGRGVTAVVVWKGTPGRVSPMPTGLRLVHDSANFAVWVV